MTLAAACLRPQRDAPCPDTGSTSARAAALLLHRHESGNDLRAAKEPVSGNTERRRNRAGQEGALHHRCPTRPLGRGLPGPAAPSAAQPWVPAGLPPLGPRSAGWTAVRCAPWVCGRDLAGAGVMMPHTPVSVVSGMVPGGSIHPDVSLSVRPRGGVLPLVAPSYLAVGGQSPPAERTGDQPEHQGRHNFTAPPRCRAYPAQHCVIPPHPRNGVPSVMLLTIHPFGRSALTPSTHLPRTGSTSGGPSLAGPRAAMLGESR